MTNGPMIQCFKCSRPLSNHISVQRGIGPICHARQRAEWDAEETQRRHNLQCHHGFVCYAPEHAHVTLARFQRRFDAMANQTRISDEICERVPALIAQASDALGLNREKVITPEISVPPFGRETIAALNLPAQRGPGNIASYVMPIDHDEQYRHLKWREMGVCPFGLDCREPTQAVAAVWQLLSLMRYHVEPHLLTESNCGWSWDRLLYQALANTLEVLGLDDDGREVQDIVERQHRKPQPLRLFAEISA